MHVWIFFFFHVLRHLNFLQVWTYILDAWIHDFSFVFFQFLYVSSGNVGRTFFFFFFLEFLNLAQENIWICPLQFLDVLIDFFFLCTENDRSNPFQIWVGPTVWYKCSYSKLLEFSFFSVHFVKFIVSFVQKLSRTDSNIFLSQI